MHSAGCRCVECRAWKAADNRAYVRKRIAEGRRIPHRTSWITGNRRVEVYERDGWICQICFEPVDRAADSNDDWAPSLDHIVPASKGGTHELTNLRLAHRWCNCIRSDEVWADEDFRIEEVAADGRS